MPIPDTPQTREEMYLNAAATGNTSGIPAQPYTRKEMYLDAIARNGGGGGSGGGVEIVNVTFVSSNDKGYEITVGSFAPCIVGDVTTWFPPNSAYVWSDEPFTIGFAKLGSGPVAIPLPAALSMATVDMSVLPTVSGDAVLDMATSTLLVSGNCVFTAAGLASRS